tara:strand:- start:255 stop:455 length:201 start_codon:yes stop_codon:yes gene_type:complete
MSNQKKDKNEHIKEIMTKIDFLQNSIGDLQNKLKDVIIYLQDASLTESTENTPVSLVEDIDHKREL